MRNLNSRVGRLEKIVQSRPPVPCESCGAPRGWISRHIHVVDPDGRPFHEERCTHCGIETSGGKAISPINPTQVHYREVLILPRPLAPLPV